MKLFDTDMGIHPQAVAILASLRNAQEEEFTQNDLKPLFNCQTSHYHNGREHGVQVVFQKTVSGPALVIAFGENRNSDSIFVQVDAIKTNINPPVCGDYFEASYYARRYFDPWDIRKTREYIIRILRDWLCTDFSSTILQTAIGNLKGE